MAGPYGNSGLFEGTLSIHGGVFHTSLDEALQGIIPNFAHSRVLPRDATIAWKY